MKKLKYTLIALLVLCMTGCNESSFLEEDPRASLYPENLLVDYSGFQSMVTSLYGMMRNEYRRADALGGGLPLVLHSAWGCGVDNLWSKSTRRTYGYFRTSSNGVTASSIRQTWWFHVPKAVVSTGKEPKPKLPPTRIRSSHRPASSAHGLTVI